jgi:hypothetical protein
MRTRTSFHDGWFLAAVSKIKGLWDLMASEKSRMCIQGAPTDTGPMKRGENQGIEKISPSN